MDTIWWRHWWWIWYDRTIWWWIRYDGDIGDGHDGHGAHVCGHGQRGGAYQRPSPVGLYTHSACHLYGYIYSGVYTHSARHLYNYTHRARHLYVAMASGVVHISARRPSPVWLHIALSIYSSISMAGYSPISLARSSSTYIYMPLCPWLGIALYM